MSWVPRWSNWSGHLSPFTRSPQSGTTKVSDADFSYITADDLRRQQQEHNKSEAYREEYGPQRDGDVLVLKNKKKDFPIHFPAYSIAKNDLTIGDVREAAAKKTDTNSRAIKLLYKGRNLKDDSRTCKSEGLRDGSEVLCAIADISPTSPSDSEEEDGELTMDTVEGHADGNTSKSRRNRGKKSKKRNKREAAVAAAAAAAASDGIPTHLGVPHSQTSTRSSSPRPPPSPSTPQDQLTAIQTTLNSFLPECENFRSNPPSDPSKRDFEYKRLSETILAQVLLKVDGVDSQGDEDARARRKAIVKEAQKVLAELDAVVKL